MKTFLSFVILGLLAGCIETTIYPVKNDTGIYVYPQIEVSPSSLAWDYISPASVASSAVITISSVGNVALDISAIRVSSGNDSFLLTSSTSPSVLQPNDSLDVVVVYTSNESDASGTLKIISDDEETPIISIPLIASGEVPHDSDADTSLPLAAPIAVCSVDPSEIEAIHGTASWIGSASYDPDGGSIVDWSWTLISVPAGATATMSTGRADRRNFTPDVAGEYVGELIVTDNDGLTSDACNVTLTATAGEGLWVETFWTHSGDDMDLHLLRPSGMLETSGDCYYANCTGWGLEWGTSMTLDNPSLDLDDIPGIGPENINIESPANGLYTVIVHDYPGSIYNGNNDVTVNVYVGGTLMWTDTRNINSEGCYEGFVTVAIPGGATSDLSSTCH